MNGFLPSVKLYELLFSFYSHKSRVKGYLRLKMTYLPKTSGSEDDNTEQAEELEVRFYKYLVKLRRKISNFLFYYTLKKK